MAAKASLIVDLTRKQQASVRPLLEEVRKANEAGDGDLPMVVAQVYWGHMVVGLVTGKERDVLSRGKGSGAGGRHRPLPTVTTR